MKLKLRDITIFNRIFGAEGGYLLDFSDRTLIHFFDEELNIDIDNEQYKEDGTSKVICAELAGDFHLGYARQLTDKSSLLFDLAF